MLYKILRNKDNGNYRLIFISVDGFATSEYEYDNFEDLYSHIYRVRNGLEIDSRKGVKIFNNKEDFNE